MGVVGWLRGFANGMLMLVILDTVVVTVAISSGIPVPSYAYFAPTWAGQSFYRYVLSWSTMQSLRQVQVNVFAFFFFYVIPSGLIFVILNFFYGLFAGLPIIIMNVLPAMSAPSGVVVGFTIVAFIFQMIADVWFIDVIIAYVFGRTPILSMIFGE
jgi:hypothetical protein